MENLISIIIRTKNEERWIGSCLRKINDQKKVKSEVIIVDNLSKDKTLEICKKFKTKVVTIKKFLPGKAINLGIRKSKGNIIVCLSAHCIPCDNNWLYNLTKNIDKQKKHVAVYGRQVPLPYSSDFDKRDLLNTFGLDKRIQKKDSFFHNANSAFLRSTWQKNPFNEELTNIEDRIWAHSIIKKNNKIVYEPKASVFHWHGVHQNMDLKRCNQIVKILENLDLDYPKTDFQKIKDLKVSLIIPQRGKTKVIKGKNLIEKTINYANENSNIKNIVVSTDDLYTAKISRKLGCFVPGLRPKELSESHIDLLTVCNYSLKQIEKRKIYSDYIIVASELYPYREKNFFNNLIKKIHYNNLDCVVAVKEENRIIWFKNNELKRKNLGESFIPSKIKGKKNFIGLYSYGFIIRPNILRNLTINDSKVGYINIKNPLSILELKNYSKFCKLFK